MRYDDGDLIDLLAAEYLLGTLAGRARARFEKLAASQRELRERIDHWDRRLNQLAAAATPVQPPPGAWERIYTRVAPLPSSQYQRGFIEQVAFWRRAAFSAGLVALVLAVVVIWPSARYPAATGADGYVVLMRDRSEQTVWTIDAQPGRAMLTVRKTGSMDLPEGKACYLWLDMGDSEAPELLGVLPDEGMGQIEVPEKLRPMLPGRLLVSIEEVSGPALGVKPSPLGIDSEWMRPLQGA